MKKVLAIVAIATLLASCTTTEYSMCGAYASVEVEKEVGVEEIN